MAVACRTSGSSVELVTGRSLFGTAGVDGMVVVEISSSSWFTDASPVWSSTESLRAVLRTIRVVGSFERLDFGMDVALRDFFSEGSVTSGTCHCKIVKNK